MPVSKGRILTAKGNKEIWRSNRNCNLPEVMASWCVGGSVASALSCDQLFCNSVDSGPLGSSVYGIPPVKNNRWVSIQPQGSS